MRRADSDVSWGVQCPGQSWEGRQHASHTVDESDETDEEYESDDIKDEDFKSHQVYEDNTADLQRVEDEKLKRGDPVNAITLGATCKNH